jgi:menaquinol-cytochrome c reductase iron-sulfur subunit
VTSRRDLFFRLGTFLLGGAMTLVLAIPGVAYLLDPVWKRGKAGAADDAEGDFFELPVRVGDLKVGEPQAFPIEAERQDAWVKYPKEPVGSVWLIRQPEGSKEPVLALSAECPHLGCGVNLAADRRNFACPCHTSAFALDGEPLNQIPPRPMDRLEVRLSGDGDPKVRVQFRRFRSQTEEKIPLA